jgi:hypothetical protein
MTRKRTEETVSETTTTTIQNPRRFDAPFATPEPGVTVGTTGDDVSSKPTPELEAQDFGLVPGGKRLPGNTDDLVKQGDHEAREKYEEVRKANLGKQNESEIDALRRRVGELEATVHGRRRD